MWKVVVGLGVLIAVLGLLMVPIFAMSIGGGERIFIPFGLVVVGGLIIAAGILSRPDPN